MINFGLRNKIPAFYLGTWLLAKKLEIKTQSLPANEDGRKIDIKIIAEFNTLRNEVINIYYSNKPKRDPDFDRWMKDEYITEMRGKFADFKPKLLRINELAHVVISIFRKTIYDLSREFNADAIMASRMEAIRRERMHLTIYAVRLATQYSLRFDDSLVKYIKPLAAEILETELNAPVHYVPEPDTLFEAYKAITKMRFMNAVREIKLLDAQLNTNVVSPDGLEYVQAFTKKLVDYIQASILAPPYQVDKEQMQVQA